MIFEDAVRINGNVLGWAIDRLDPQEAETAVASFPPGHIVKWKSGVAEPTFIQAAALAKKLGIPFGYLFLSEVPTRTLSLPDLRTLSGIQIQKPSIAMMLVIDDAIRKQHWYSDFLKGHTAKAQPYVGSFTIHANPQHVAAEIRDALEIDEQMRTESAPSVSGFLTELVRRSERLGIIVLRSGTALGNSHQPLNVREFRGFALPDPFAPMIFINSRDAMVAQLFTWAHEIAHIWINAQGLSLIDFSRRSREQGNEIESFCNEVAADILVPSASFSHNWNRSLSVTQNIETLRARYRVSTLVVLRKAYDVGLIQQAEFYEGLKRYYEIPLEEKLKKSEEKKGGGNYYNSLYARNSTTITAAIAEGYSSGAVLATEACRVLHISHGTLDKIVAAT